MKKKRRVKVSVPIQDRDKIKTIKIKCGRCGSAVIEASGPFNTLFAIGTNTSFAMEPFSTLQVKKQSRDT